MFSLNIIQNKLEIMMNSNAVVNTQKENNEDISNNTKVNRVPEKKYHLIQSKTKSTTLFEVTRLNFQGYIYSYGRQNWSNCFYDTANNICEYVKQHITHMMEI